MLLDVRDLYVSYPGRRAWLRRAPRVRAVDGVSFTIDRGETLALVGESGSGKTTTARAIAGLAAIDRGTVEFAGANLSNVSVANRSHEHKQAIQYVFQNPDASLNPRRRVAYSLGRTLEHFFGVKGAERERGVCELLESVRLDPDFRHRFPGQLSGGERQRVAIARALASQPQLIICDEVVSALDVSVQASILELLSDVRERLGVSYLFIAHDLAVVRWLADKVAVMYGASMMEYGEVDAVFGPPSHPYAESLVDAVPSARPDGSLLAKVVDARVGDPAATGCAFHTRCQHAISGLCETTTPPGRTESDLRKTVWCHVELPDLASRQVKAAS